MFIFHRVADLQHWLRLRRKSGRTIGFAPTMGALHDGHLSLIREALIRNDVAVASIFVNPTQFNEASDLEKYPRTPEHDLQKLQGAGCAAVLMPSVEEIYPPEKDISVKLGFGSLAEVMEGQFRPGHFAGMATVVNRLLEIVQPDRLYMGQKDFQQLTVVRDMLRQFDSPVELVMVASKREPDGLAMSSRNTRLSEAMRTAAPVIFETLEWAKRSFLTTPVAVLQEEALKKLENASLRPEYFEIVDGHTLMPVNGVLKSDFVVACVAAWAGDVRLIDNIVIIP